MVDLAKVEYRVTCVTTDGKQLDLTPISTGLGWSEGTKELSAKIQLKIALVEVDGKSITELIKPFTPIFVFANMTGEFEEVIRGKISKWSITESSREYFLDVEAADEAGDLRHSQDNFYFTDGHTSSSILNEILSKWSVPAEIHVSDIKHTKKVYRGKYLCDMIADILKDVKEQGGGEYFIRAKNGVIEIIQRGHNSTIYHFDVADNLLKVSENFDASKIVTQVQVVGKQKTEGKPYVEQTVNGKTEYGTRRVIYERSGVESSGEAQKAAKKILDEQGDLKRKTSIEAPDIPTLRKGDKIRVRSSSGESYFFVKSIRHNAVSQKMTLELDEDKKENSALGQIFSTAAGDESESSEPP